MRKIPSICFFLSFLILSVIVPHSASAETENETKIVNLTTQAEKQTVETAKKAHGEKIFNQAKHIAFDEILRSPNDAELNFRYAQQQVKSDDLLGAAGTLERILISHPELHEVRLFYAVVLFRLDNLIDAGNELDKLETVPLSGDLKAQVKIYQNEIKKRKRKTHLSLTQSNGFQYDDNRNASPSSKRVLFSDFPVNTADSTRRHPDSSFLDITTVEVEQDLGTQAGHQLIGSFTHFLQEQKHINSLDLGSFQYDLGALIKTKWFDFTPTYSGSHVFLSDENYLRTSAANFNFRRVITPKWDTTAAFRAEHQDFLPIEENQAARNRTGWEETASGGTSYTLPWNMKVGMGILYSHKDSREKFETYDRVMIRPYHIWLLGRGQFLINSMDAAFDVYEHADTAVAGRIRHDKAMRYRLTYGVPLSTLLVGIGKYLPSMIGDITASATYEYYRVLSNITNYTYSNNKVQAMLTKKWEF